MTTASPRRLALIGAGNLGSALARGWVASGYLNSGDIHITRRHASKLTGLEGEGFRVGTDNRAAVEDCDCVVIAVRPGAVAGVVEEISTVVGDAVVISVATGVNLDSIRSGLGEGVSVARAMPNTAVETLSAMTCLAGTEDSGAALAVARDLFDALGQTLEIDEEMMTPATALCACGIAFFLRTVRAAAQGGHRNRVRCGGRTAPGGPDRTGGGRPGADRSRSSRERDRPSHDPQGMHHRGPQRAGTPRIQFRDDPWDSHLCATR